MNSRPIQIVWFKRDLRVHDHRALVMAARQGPVLPLFIAEPELWQQPDYSARQWAFVEESLTELRTELAALGQPLIVRVGDAVETLDRARRKFGKIALWSHEETGNGWTYARDLNVAAWAKQTGVTWTEVQQA
ncbi:MAG: deoxyribodipyrimidine photo-lyase, partial [Pseudomonadota bacterium]